jgi:hypothetical protein
VAGTVLAAAAGPVAGVAVAQGGGCASCSQYTDPLAGLTTTTTHTTPRPVTTTTTIAPMTTTPPPISSTPVVTSAAPASVTQAATAGSTRTLPFTGLDDLLLGAIGAGMAGAGLLVRRRVV